MNCGMKHLNILEMLRDIGKDNDDRQGFMALHWLTHHATEDDRARYNEFVGTVNRTERNTLRETERAFSLRSAPETLTFAADRK